MYSLSFLSIFLSVYVLFITAKRIEYKLRGKFEIRLAEALTTFNHLNKMASIAFCAIGVFALISEMGLAVGCFTGIVMWIFIASAMVIFTPFNKIRGIQIVGLLTIAFIVEIVLQIS
ncbi:MAG: hypothetical protein AAGI25_00015 [Bacteroidota bacterium]